MRQLIAKLKVKEDSDMSLSPYLLPEPTDEATAEVTRLDGQHDMFKVATGAFYHAPVGEHTKLVVDIGCGTGIWCKAYAIAHPHARVVGVDIAPPQPQTTNHAFPQSCSFLKFDVNSDWAVLANLGWLDYVHARMLILAVRDWPKLFKEAFNTLRPGGLFETFDGDVRLQAADPAVDTESSPAMQWYDCLREHMMSMGVNPSAVVDLGSQLQEAGFTLLSDRRIQTHLDPDRSSLESEQERRYVATFQQQNWVDLIDRMTPRIFGQSSTLGVDGGAQLALEAKDDLLNNGARRGYFVTFHLRVTQKPEA